MFLGSLKASVAEHNLLSTVFLSCLVSPYNQ